MTGTQPRKKGHQLPARVATPLWTTLQKVAKRDRRSVSQTVIILLEDALRARGEPVSEPEATEEKK